MKSTTIQGKPVDKDVLASAHLFISDQDLVDRVDQILHGEPWSLIDPPIGLSRLRGFAVGTPTQMCNVVTKLPADHCAVLGLVAGAKAVIDELRALPVSDLRYHYTFEDRPSNPITNALLVCGFSHAQQLFPSIYSLALYLIDNPALTSRPPRTEEYVMTDVASTFASFAQTHPTELLDYATRLHEKKRSIGYAMTIPAMMGRLEAVDRYCENYVTAQGKDNLVLDGIVHSWNLKGNAEMMTETLIEHEISKDHIRKRIKAAHTGKYEKRILKNFGVY